MTNMSRFAEHVISVANANEIPITNLQLQKTMYFALRNSKDVLDDETIQSIYDEPFLVWRYGPVVESVYDRFYSYGANPIKESFDMSECFSEINQLIIKFLNIDVFDLVDASHTHEFWKDNEQFINYGRSSVEYPLEEVLI